MDIDRKRKYVESKLSSANYFKSTQFRFSLVLFILTLILGIIEKSVLISIAITVIQFGISVFVYSMSLFFEKQEIREQIWGEKFELIKTISELNDPVKHDILITLNEITQSIVRLKSKPEIMRMEVEKLRLLKTEFTADARGMRFTYEARPHAQNIHRAFCYFIREILPDGSSYYTISNLDFWTDSVMKNPLSLLKISEEQASSRNISFYRVILASKDVNSFNQNEKELFREHIFTTKRHPNFDTRFLKISQDKIFNEIGNFAYCICPSGRIIIIEMIYEKLGKRYQFQKTRIYSVSKTGEHAPDQKNMLEVYKSRFHKYNDQAKSVTEYRL